MAGIKITDLIPYGYENAIPRRELVKEAYRSGLVSGSVLINGDRETRKLIQAEKERGTVVLHRPNGGYYQPTNNDKGQLRRYIAQTRGMAFTLMNEARYAERMLTDIEDGYKVGDSE